MELIDPSFNPSGGKYSEDPKIVNGTLAILKFNMSVWLKRSP
jgi:hypothetical protein